MARLKLPTMAANRDFVDYCLELLSSVGPCAAKRMFGGWGIALDGLNLALIADLGSGEKLWLKSDLDNQATFEAQGCQRFGMTIVKKGVPKLVTMGYYSAPVDAMESASAMTPWARLAFMSARTAHQRKPARRTATRQRPNDKPPGA